MEGRFYAKFPCRETWIPRPTGDPSPPSSIFEAGGEGSAPSILDFRGRRGGLRPSLSVYRDKGETYFVPFIKDEGGGKHPPCTGRGWHAKTREYKAKNLRIKNELYPLNTHMNTIIKVYTVTCTTLFLF